MVEDGSHPLEWTVVHREYRDLFERRLQLTLQTVGVKEEELAESARIPRRRGGRRLPGLCRILPDLGQRS